MNLYNKDNNPNDDFLDNSFNNKKDNNNNSLWSRIFKNKENQVYSEIIVKGFVWVVMFVISLIALIIVFKDSGSSKKEVVVISNKDSKSLDSNNFPTFTNNVEDKFLNSNSSRLSQDTSDSNRDSKLEKRPLTNKDDLSNKSSLKSTPLNKTNNSNKKEITNQTEENDSLDNLIRTVTEPVAKKVVDHKPNVAATTANKKNTLKENTATSHNKVWLVTIYSGSEEALAKEKWKEIESSNPSLFFNKQPYIIKTNIENKGIYYRLSLGEVKNNQCVPYFLTAKDASSYCQYLKDNNVNCFVTESTQNNFTKLINK